MPVCEGCARETYLSMPSGDTGLPGTRFRRTGSERGLTTITEQAGRQTGAPAIAVS
jgi:hypothetical protein